MSFQVAGFQPATVLSWCWHGSRLGCSSLAGVVPTPTQNCDQLKAQRLKWPNAVWESTMVMKKLFFTAFDARCIILLRWIVHLSCKMNFKVSGAIFTAAMLPYLCLGWKYCLLICWVLMLVLSDAMKHRPWHVCYLDGVELRMVVERPFGCKPVIN